MSKVERLAFLMLPMIACAAPTSSDEAPVEPGSNQAALSSSDCELNVYVTNDDHPRDYDSINGCTVHLEYDQYWKNAVSLSLSTTRPLVLDWQDARAWCYHPDYPNLPSREVQFYFPGGYWEDGDEYTEAPCDTGERIEEARVRLGFSRYQ
jgi:hypothetical protein